MSEALTLAPSRRLTRSQRAAQRLLDYCNDPSAWGSKPSVHVIDALRILAGKGDVPAADACPS
jgi:hypothetical protein